MIIDPDLPEQNPSCGSLTVLKTKDLEGFVGGKYEHTKFDGFFIMVRVDPRFYVRDHTTEQYTLTMRSKTELLLKLPAWSYDMLHERDQLLTEPGYKPLVDAIDNAHKALKQNDARLYMHLKLDFKAPVQLSGEVLFPNFEDTQMAIPIEAKVSLNKDENHYFVYKIARLDKEPFHTGKRAERPSAMSAGAALFAKSAATGK